MHRRCMFPSRRPWRQDGRTTAPTRRTTVDLRHSEADEQFRAEFRAYLDEHLPVPWRDPGFWHRLPPEEEFRLRRDWEARKARDGWAGVAWPREYGGRGGTRTQKAIYDE